MESLTLREEELLSIYEDLLSMPAVEEPVADPETTRRLEAEEDMHLVVAAAERLLIVHETPIEETESTLSDTLRQLRPQAAAVAHLPPEPETEAPSASEPAYRRVIWHLKTFAARLEQVRASLPNKEHISEDAPIFPVSVLSRREWEALARVSVSDMLLFAIS